MHKYPDQVIDRCDTECSTLLFSLVPRPLPPLRGGVAWGRGYLVPAINT